MRIMRKKQPGFTFVELLFAIVVMGTMFSLALVVFVGMLRFYVFAGTVRQNQENGRNVMDSISRDIRFEQLVYPNATTNSSSTLCVYNPNTQKLTGYDFDATANTVNKYTPATVYATLNDAKTAANINSAAACKTGAATNILAENMWAVGFNVLRTIGASPNIDTSGNVQAVTIRFDFITKPTKPTGVNCDARDIYCNKITYNTAVSPRGANQVSLGTPGVAELLAYVF
jgi:prepilin-type N-terminal cleavage/methylation domain-containing protein